MVSEPKKQLLQIMYSNLKNKPTNNKINTRKNKKHIIYMKKKNYICGQYNRLLKRYLIDNDKRDETYFENI